MRTLYLVSLLVFFACNSRQEMHIPGAVDTLEASQQPGATLPGTFSNQRFRNVTVQKTGNDTWLVRGEGQIFEASFNWVVEDGHEELKKGFSMTDAGAPEWGKFEFIINVVKKHQNSTLTLILFESSPQDGRRQHELPISLN